MPKQDATDVVEFTDNALHGRERFIKGNVIGFKDKGAAEYFVKCGWAKPSKAEPAFVYDEGSIEIDPDTIHNESGMKVADLEVQSGS